MNLQKIGYIPNSVVNPSQTKLLITGSYPIRDETGKPITIFGNTVISTSQIKVGLSSIYIDGTGDYLATPSTGDLSFGSGNFTLDFWIYSTNASDFIFLGLGGGAAAWTASGHEFTLFKYTDNKLYFQVNVGLSNVNIVSTSPISIANAWHHIAIVRNSTVITMYLDGAPIGTYTIGASSIYTITNGTPRLTIGTLPSLDTPFASGYLSHIRITKGLALWTTTFTPPNSILDYITSQLSYNNYIGV